MNPTRSLTASRLFKAFNATPVLVDASLSVPEGELLFLVGPSGCGKSTLLRIIAGLESADSGDVVLGDRSILQLPPSKRGVGLVFQNYALWPHLTVVQHLDFALAQQPQITKEQRKQRIMETLNLVELMPHINSLPAQLSGGQQQRLALARSLCLNPAVLLLDEPFSNLDLKLRRQVMKSLRIIQAQLKMTMIIVAHDIEAVIHPRDLIAVVESGRIIQSGMYQEVQANPVSRFVREIVLPNEGV